MTHEDIRRLLKEAEAKVHETKTVQELLTELFGDEHGEEASDMARAAGPDAVAELADVGASPEDVASATWLTGFLIGVFYAQKAADHV